MRNVRISSRACSRFVLMGLASLISCTAPLHGVMPPGMADVAPTGFPARCSVGEVEVMLLGTGHFAGSSGDPVKQPLEDVLTPARQAQLADLAEHLARWAPEQIAVEWTTTFADSTTARYQRYVRGEPTQSRDEVVQVAFRLARRLGHSTVFPIDYQMGVGNDSIEALFARRPEFKHRMDSLQTELQRTADASSAWLHAATIIEQLRATNTEPALHGGNSLGMFGSLLAAGEGANYGGPQLLARWYERNFRMAHNLTRVLRPETKRVLILVGSGHVPPLRNILDESPAFCPVSPLPYLQ